MSCFWCVNVTPQFTEDYAPCTSCMTHFKQGVVVFEVVPVAESTLPPIIEGMAATSEYVVLNEAAIAKLPVPPEAQLAIAQQRITYMETLLFQQLFGEKDEPDPPDQQTGP
jgi:hypothetical protein